MCWCVGACLDGSVEVELICDSVFDYGRVPGEGRW